ncbi:MAG TPA: ABC transporter permease [Solirubrobacterales bacterium]|nr:ABC transporter permease [Solirubrobacterales bacterium]
MTGLIGLNLVRNPGRTALTAAGIAIGVATIVALLALTQGLKQSVGGLSHLGGASLGIFQDGVADPTASVLPESTVERVREQPGVEDAAPIQLVTDAMPASPSALVFGVRRDSFVQRRLVLTAGRDSGPGEAMVGSAFADSEGVGPGDEVVLGGERFPVSGVYESGVAFEDAGVVIPLAAASELAGRPRSVTTVAVVLEPSAAAETVTEEITRAVPGTMAISNPGEAARANPSFEIVTKAVVVIAALALILGAIAVTNTMAMAVLERRRELALLSAIGWSRRQVAGILLGEGAGVGLLGAGIGILAGVLISRLIVGLLGAGDFVTPELTAWGLARGMLVGLAIGILGGLYPAWSVSRRPPAEMLGRF